METQTQINPQTQTNININNIINSMYLNYLRIAEKNRKIEAVKKVASSIGYKWLVDSVRWDARSGAAWVTLEVPDDLKAKIEELWKYAFPRYRFIDAIVGVTTKDICKDISVYENEVVGKYCYDRDDYEGQTTTYIKLGEVETNGVKVYIYLQVSDEDTEDC